MASDELPLAGGQVYVARPDHHLYVEDGVMRGDRGARENFGRPAIDPLFRSGASSFGASATAVLLSGAGGDGAAGINAVKAAGGRTIVQDPSQPAFNTMPSAAAALQPDFVIPYQDVGPLLASLVDTTPGRGQERSEGGSEGGKEVVSMCSCPDCGGVLREEEGPPSGFRCHVGHRYSFQALLEGQSGVLDAALWTSLRVLREKISLLDRLASDFGAKGQGASSKRFREATRELMEAERAIDALINRDGVFELGPEGVDSPREEAS